VLDQVASPKVVAADTMNHWIENDRAALVRLLPRIDILTLNDEEARMLSGEHNLVKAGRAIIKMGPNTVLIKRGEYGVLQFSKDAMFAVPAYPLEEVVDPTGAGDTFAGAFMGYIARKGVVNESVLRTAVVYGCVLGSFVVEQFSVRRIAALTWEDIEARYRAFIELTDSHHSRWISQ
jgi:sugar/nucleoside kinase (ribokinase family)